MLALELSKDLQSALSDGKIKLESINNNNRNNNTTFTCVNVDNGKQLKIKIENPEIVGGDTDFNYNGCFISHIEVDGYKNIYGNNIFNVTVIVFSDGKDDGAMQRVIANV